MRKVARASEMAPSILASERARAARSEIENILLLDDNRRRQRRTPLDVKLFSDFEVRDTLGKLFKDKCAYCEQHILSPDRGDIDHFRPRQASSDASGGGPSEHHYAWLAYEWGNLYFACKNCNRTKTNLFPVLGKRAPLLLSLDEVRQSEVALLVDPCFDNPKSHLTFSWNGWCDAKTERGEATISVFSLNRPELIHARSKSFRDLLTAIDSALSSSDFSEKLLTPLLSDDRPFVGGMRILADRISNELEAIRGRPFPRRGYAQLPKHLLSASREQLVSVIETARSESLRTASEHLGTPRPYQTLNRPSTYGSAYYPAAFGKFALPAAKSSPQRVLIRSFKAIEYLKFDFSEHRSSKVESPPCLIILGENATGKSSVLEAIALTLAGKRMCSALIDNPSSFLRRKDKKQWALVRPDTVDIKISFYGIDQPFELSIDPVRQVFEGSEQPATLVLGYGPRRYFAKNGGTYSRSHAAHVQSLFSSKAEIPNPSDWLRRLDDERFYPVARALREVLALNPDDELVRNPNFGICVAIHGQLMPLERMSDGYKSLFAMTVDIMRKLLDHWENLEEARAFVLIDEIETHLHPRWKMVVMSSLRRAFPNVTFIVTTHDPLCLRGLDDGEVAVLRRDKEQNIERLEDLPSIKGMRVDQILTSDYFGLSSTADPEVEAKLAFYADSAAVPKQARTKDDIAEFAALGEQLSQTLQGADSAATQIAHDAVKLYLESRREAPVREMTEARRMAVQAVLSAFKTIPKA